MDSQLHRRKLLKIDNSDIIYALRKQYIITFSKLMLPEHVKDQHENVKTLKQLQLKMVEYDKPLNCDPHDDNSYLNTYMQQVEEMFAEIQMHYGIDVDKVSIARFFTLRNTIERKFKNSTAKNKLGDMPINS